MACKEKNPSTRAHAKIQVGDMHAVCGHTAQQSVCGRTTTCKCAPSTKHDVLMLTSRHHETLCTYTIHCLLKTHSDKKSDRRKAKKRRSRLAYKRCIILLNTAAKFLALAVRSWTQSSCRHPHVRCCSNTTCCKLAIVQQSTVSCYQWT